MSTTLLKEKPATQSEFNNNIEELLQQQLLESNGSMCVGSTTGEVMGIAAGLNAVRSTIEPMMCFWGAFVK